MRSILGSAALAVALMIGTAQAAPIVIVISLHNLDYAKNSCNHFRQWVDFFLPEDQEVARAGIAECKLAGDERKLGRQLEETVINQLAINTRCQGVSVFRENHPDFDAKSNSSELAPQKAKAHWDLFLDYNPGSQTHGWTLFPYGAEGWSLFPHTGVRTMSGKMVEGEGTPGQIADQICIVVTNTGANIR